MSAPSARCNDATHEKRYGQCYTCHLARKRAKRRREAEARRVEAAAAARLAEATERDAVDHEHEVRYSLPVDLTATWRTRAACVGRTDEMYPENIRSSAAWDAARAICASCEVTEECLTACLEWERADARHGMFGGMTPAERTALVLKPRSSTGTERSTRSRAAV